MYNMYNAMNTLFFVFWCVSTGLKLNLCTKTDVCYSKHCIPEIVKLCNGLSAWILRPYNDGPCILRPPIQPEKISS